MNRVRYYSTESQDMVTAGKPRELPADYTWLPHTRLARLQARVIGQGARFVGRFVIGPALRYRVVGLAKLRRYSGGCFLYANHTQPVGDAFMPLVFGGRRPTYVIASAANLAVPVLGPLVPRGGGLVLPTARRQLGAFSRVVASVIAAGAMVTVYPEGHVWPYATRIRAFVPGAFHYPVATHAPVFVQTTTYQPGRWRPRITVYIDGPFWPAEALAKAAQRAQLAAQVQATMQARARLNTTTYIDYRRREE